MHKYYVFAVADIFGVGLVIPLLSVFAKSLGGGPLFYGILVKINPAQTKQSDATSVTNRIDQCSSNNLTCRTPHMDSANCLEQVSEDQFRTTTVHCYSTTAKAHVKLECVCAQGGGWYT